MKRKVNGQLIRETRLEKSWSQEVLADKAGISLRTVQRMEMTGTASINSRLAVARALDLDPADLDAAVSSDKAAVSSAGDSRQRLKKGASFLILKLDTWYCGEYSGRIPAPLKIISLLFLFGAIHSLRNFFLNIGPDNFPIGTLNTQDFPLINLVNAVIKLIISREILRFKPLWRKWALFYISFGLVSAVFVFFAPFTIFADSWSTTGFRLGSFDFSGVAAVRIVLAFTMTIFLVYLWQLNVLNRPDIKKEFEKSR